MATVALALIASAETLLCATAVDRLHDGVRTNYDKELIAQGVGNMVCGVLGALPATGVIVRSSANVEAGGETRASAIYHGIWLLGLVALAPFVLALIPTSALGAILVFIGVKLMNFKAMKTLWEEGGRSEFFIYAATVATIVSVDLLSGVVLGLVLSLLKMVQTFSSLEVSVTEADGGRVDVSIRGAATFVRLPVLAEALEKLPKGREVHLHIGALAHIDHACHDVLESWEKQYRGQGGEVITEWDIIAGRRDPDNVFDGGPRHQSGDQGACRLRHHAEHVTARRRAVCVCSTIPDIAPRGRTEYLWTGSTTTTCFTSGTWSTRAPSRRRAAS